MNKPVKMTNLGTLIEIYKDPDRKSVSRIINECIILFFTYREIPKHYFSRYLFKKDVTNIKDHLPNKLLAKISHFFNDKRFKEVLDNKLYFDLYYSKFNVSLVKILMFNHGKTFLADGEIIEIKDVDDFRNLLNNIFQQNPGQDSIFIKKTYASSGGKNIFKLSRHNLKTDPDMVNTIYSGVSKSEFLFQAVIKQHADMDILNPSSLNTLRIDTFIDSSGNIDIISGYLRMSVNGSYVDNISSGGYMVGIDLQKGTLRKRGYSLINISGVKIISEHPLTNTTFENFKIPFLPQALELVRKAASFTTGLRLVGWDVAIGESGPVLIEGNSDYDIRGNDMTEEGYLTNATFRKVVAESKIL